MEPTADLPPCDWDATRLAYLERFGPLFHSRTTPEADGPPFAILCFWDPEKPGAPAVYASFGAPAGELFLTAVAPGLGVSALLDGAARDALDDLDLPALLEVKAPWTPFDGVIVLPDDEGGFAVPAADGSTRPVRRAIAVTTRERRRAERRSPEAVLPALHAAGAEIADVLRACTVEPARTQTFLKYCAPACVRRLHRQQAELDEEIADLRAHSASTDEEERYAAELRAALAHYATCLPPVSTDADRAARLAAASEEVRYEIIVHAAVERGLDHIVSELYWDPFALSGFRIMLSLGLTTHPDARPLLDAAVDSEGLPAPASLSPDDHRRRLLSLLAVAAAALAPGALHHTPDTLLACGVEALSKPRDASDPDYVPVLTASAGWPIAIKAMLREVFPAKTQDDRAMMGAYNLALSMCGSLDEQSAGDTPFERLASMACQLAFYMMFGYAMVAGKGGGEPVN